MDGILLVDKERGPTSHDVVARVRAQSGERSVGHAGTLDPLATGLLVMCLGKALKFVEFMQGHDKEYEVTVRLGRVTETDDAEGRILVERDPGQGTATDIERAMQQFKGEIRQRPPIYSAVKVAGRRLYDYARKGESVAIPERTVRVDELELLEFTLPMVRLRVRCGKGMYVRSLVRDVGETLGCGACVETLRRTASGPFRVEQAKAEYDVGAVLPIDAGLADMPKVVLPADYAGRFLKGEAVDALPVASVVRVYEGDRFLGVGGERNGRLRPRKVIP